MKRLVLFGISIFLIIIGGFLVVDKMWLHKIFEIKPGSCLILEEKYCKTGKIKYENDKLMGIEYIVDKNTKLFSPITNQYIIAEANDPSKKAIIIGNQSFDKSKGITESDNYQIIFDGDYFDTYKNRGVLKQIKKGLIFGYSNKNKETSVVLTPLKIGMDEFENIYFEMNEEKVKNNNI